MVPAGGVLLVDFMTVKSVDQAEERLNAMFGKLFWNPLSSYSLCGIMLTVFS